MELWLVEDLLSRRHGRNLQLMHLTQPIRPGLRFPPSPTSTWLPNVSGDVAKIRDYEIKNFVALERSLARIK